MSWIELPTTLNLDVSFWPAWHVMAGHRLFIVSRQVRIWGAGWLECEQESSLPLSSEPHPSLLHL